MLTGENIKTEMSKLMKLHNVTPEMIAVRLGITANMVYKWASPKYSYIPRELYLRLLNKIFEGERKRSEKDETKDN